MIIPAFTGTPTFCLFHFRLVTDLHTGDRPGQGAWLPTGGHQSLLLGPLPSSSRLTPTCIIIIYFPVDLSCSDETGLHHLHFHHLHLLLQCIVLGLQERILGGVPFHPLPQYRTDHGHVLTQGIRGCWARGKDATYPWEEQLGTTVWQLLAWLSSPWPCPHLQLLHLSLSSESLCCLRVQQLGGGLSCVTFIRQLRCQL